MSAPIDQLRVQLAEVEGVIRVLEDELTERRTERDRLLRAIGEVPSDRPALALVSSRGDIEVGPIRLVRKPRAVAAAAVAPVPSDTVSRLFRKFEPGQRIRAAMAITYGERALTIDEGGRGRVHSIARGLPLMLIEWDDAPGVLLRTSFDAIDPVPAGEGTPCAP